MRYGVARVITTTCLVVVAVLAKKSSISSLVGDGELEMGTQQTQLQELAPTTAQTRASLIHPSLSLDSGLLKPLPITSTLSSASNSMGKETKAITSTKQDVATTMARDVTKEADSLVDRGATLSSSIARQDTTTNVATLDTEASKTLIKAKHTASYVDHLMLNVSRPTGVTRNRKTGIVNTTLVDIPRIVGTSLEDGVDTVSSGLNGVTQKVNSNVAIVQPKLNNVTDAERLMMDAVTSISGTKSNDVQTTVSSTIASDKQTVKRTMDSAVKPVTIVVQTVAPPVRSTISTVAGATSTSVKNVASVVERVATDTTVATTAASDNSTAPSVANEVTKTIAKPARSAVNTVTNTFAKPVKAVVSTVDTSLNAVPMNSVIDTAANMTISTEKSVPATVPTVFKTVSPVSNKVTSKDTDSTVHAVTKASSDAIKAMRPAVNKVPITVTNARVDPVTPAVKTVIKSADMKQTTVAHAAFRVVETVAPIVDTVPGPLSTTILHKVTDKVVDTETRGSVPNLKTNPASRTKTGATILSTEGMQTATKVAHPPMSRDASTMTDTTMTSTEQSLQKEEERTKSANFEVIIPKATDATKEVTDLNDSRSKAGNEFETTHKPGSTTTSPSLSSLNMNWKPSTKLKESSAVDINSGSSSETMESFDNLSTGAMSSTDVGNTPELKKTILPPEPVAPLFTLAPWPDISHISTLPTVRPPLSLPSGSKDTQVTQEAQARHPHDVSGKATSGTLVLLAVVGLAGCAAVIASVVYMKKNVPEATDLDGIQSSIPTADGARGSWDSVYNDPLGTRYSSIVMLTPNGNGVCIL